VSTAGLRHYSLEHRVGGDSLSDLYLATLCSPDKTETQVLVMCAPAPETSPDSPPAQLLREHTTMASLHHSTIVQVLDAGRNDDIYFLVFEYVHGPDLEDLLSRAGSRALPLPVDLVLYIGQQLAAALSYAHARPYPPAGAVGYHGSLCPARVHLSISGTLKLRGFGAGPAGLSYRCPEQLRASAGSKAGDLFSLGVILFEALCGEALFDGATEHEIRESLSACRVPSIRSLRPDVPEGLEGLLRRCLHADPASRHASADDLLAELTELIRYRQVSNPAGLLADFIWDAFPERNRNNAARPLAPGETPPWEELCHRLSARLVDLPRSMEGRHSGGLRLIQPGTGEAAASAAPAPSLELSGG
jgi:serine/threonine-protein kinase